MHRRASFIPSVPGNLAQSLEEPWRVQETLLFPQHNVIHGDLLDSMSSLHITVLSHVHFEVPSLEFESRHVCVDVLKVLRSKLHAVC